MYKHSKLHLLEALNQIEAGAPISIILLTVNGPVIRSSRMVNNAEAFAMVGMMEHVKADVLKSVLVQNMEMIPEQRQLTVIQNQENNNSSKE